MTLDEAEKRCVARALREAKGVKMQAVKILGCSGKQIYHLLRRHGYAALVNSTRVFQNGLCRCGNKIPPSGGTRRRKHCSKRCRLRAADRARRVHDREAREFMRKHGSSAAPRGSREGGGLEAMRGAGLTPAPRKR